MGIPTSLPARSASLLRTVYRAEDGLQSTAQAGSDLANYLEPSWQLQNQALFTDGVVRGLGVEVRQQEGDYSVRVAPGVALDAGGRLIALEAGARAFLGGDKEATAIPVTAAGVALELTAGSYILGISSQWNLRGDELGTPTQLEHAPRVSLLRAEDGPPGPDWVILAQVTYDPAVGVGLQLGGRRGASLRLQAQGYVPVGAIVPFAGDADSLTGQGAFLPCDGRAVPVSEYPDLFAVLGVRWGAGPDAGQFCLPDLRGRFLRGVDGGSGRDPDAAGRTASAAGGHTGDRVGSVQDSATARPRDAQFGIRPQPDHRHQLPTWDGQGGAREVGTGHSGADLIPPEWSEPAGGHSHEIDHWDNETRPKNAAVQFLIRCR